MAEIDIQQMVKDYNNILQKDYYEPYAKYDAWEQQAKGNSDLLDEIKKFKQRYGAVEENFSLDDMPAEATLLKIEQNGKDIILPNFDNSSFTKMNGEDKVLEEMFESGHKEGDPLKDIKLDRPAIFAFDENGQYIKEKSGKLTLYDVGSYYFSGGNATTSSPEPPPAKPEPSPETPVNTESTSQLPSKDRLSFKEWSKKQDNEEAYRRLNEEANKKSKKQAEYIEKYIGGNFRAQETSKQQSAEIEANMEKIREEKKTKEAQKSELKNNIGPDNEKGYVSSAVGSTSRSWHKNHTNEENRFIDARRYYAKNLDTIEQQKSRIIAAKDSFLKNYDESMISDESMGKMKAAFEEAKSEHNQSILEAKRAGRSAPLLNDAKVNSQINSQIAQKVFGKAEDAELAAVDYMRKKNNAEGIIARAENRNSVLRKYIDSAQEKGENKIARGAKAGGLGWKGKAAIFGGVALGALALVGVASMVMSGGRQQNSNLYNPYQAMY